MIANLPQTYLIGLCLLLVIIAILVGKQLYKVRKDEMTLIKLEKEDSKTNEDSAKMYELASVQLKKRLYPQATTTLKQALKKLDGEPQEAKALIENALGFALAAQNDFKSAVIHYKKALTAKSEYPVALNNLGFAYQRLLKEDEAYKNYQEVLKLDPNNKTATSQIKRLERIIGKDKDRLLNKKGF
jgi:Flp pilus assembly protein TadD, contains TPR repeats